MRLIDADRAWSITQSEMDMQGAYLPVHFKKWVLDKTPTVDPVKHGHWVSYESGAGIHCSRCKHRCRYMDIDNAYCPNCGAKMDKEAE